MQAAIPWQARTGQHYQEAVMSIGRACDRNGGGAVIVLYRSPLRS